MRDRGDTGTGGSSGPTQGYLRVARDCRQPGWYSRRPQRSDADDVGGRAGSAFVHRADLEAVLLSVGQTGTGIIELAVHAVGNRTPAAVAYVHPAGDAQRVDRTDIGVKEVVAVGVIIVAVCPDQRESATHGILVYCHRPSEPVVGPARGGGELE